jgi:hypothetical protein
MGVCGGEGGDEGDESDIADNRDDSNNLNKIIKLFGSTLKEHDAARTPGRSHSWQKWGPVIGQRK